MPPSRFRFRTSDVFPSSSPLARWLVTVSAGLNDVLLVNGWLLEGLEGDAPTHENIYRVRLSAMHVFELAKYLRDGMKHAEVAAFTSKLRPEAKPDLDTVLGLFTPANAFRSRLEAARHGFAHYTELGQKPVQKALTTLAAEESEVVVGTTGEFRAHYADEVALRLFFPAVRDKAAFGSFIAELSEFTIALTRIAEEMVATHFARQPKGTLKKAT